MSRFFAFGCSFTRYKWLTWADLISDQFDEYQNWGNSGSGNHFIFNSLIECNQRNKLQKSDTVVICWTNVDREDRYTSLWLNPGNIYTQNTYPADWVKEFVTEKGCLIRDLAFIKATKLILDNIGCKYLFLSIVPFNYNNYNKHSTNNNDILDLYKDVLETIKGSYYEIIFNFQWQCRSKIDTTYLDYHPLPDDHAKYINLVMPEYEITASMKKLAIEQSLGITSNENFIPKFLWKNVFRF